MVGPLLGAATPDVIVGGRVAVTVDVAIRTSEANALAVAGMLRGLADECALRAQVCRSYEAALGVHASAVERWEAAQRSYRRDVASYEAAGDGDVVRRLGLPPAPPVRPPRPASWVEVGGG